MSTERQRSKVKKVMHEHKHGALKSGSGHKVKKPKAGNCDRDVRVVSIQTAQESQLIKLI